MTTSRAENIEIFVWNVPQEKLLEWVSRSVGELGPAEEGGDATIYSSRIGPVVITESVSFGACWTGLFFNSARTPWQSDLECARECASALACTVRCHPGATGPGGDSHSDHFLEISGAGEILVRPAG